MTTVAAGPKLAGYFTGSPCDASDGAPHLVPVSLEVAGDCTVVDPWQAPWPPETRIAWCPHYERISAR